LLFSLAPCTKYKDFDVLRFRTAKNPWIFFADAKNPWIFALPKNPWNFQKSMEFSKIHGFFFVSFKNPWIFFG
jgi:hypothetical protein